ncbi:hypothetical protein KY290_010930 [Solanum tuberosum]|uniref:Replication protein A 70 kDa DNA-binding subunit B/D first OB fold domain-containing protein n=1 Tax=Solanum tuberosum TaxID=4113 RepID=A0ABQ7VZ64_SOLTU|nr:hypothetical protein KY290_010930 [Solanum tuberosum]
MTSLDMILIDEKGTLVHAIIWKNQVNRFRANLAEGSVIIIRNFKVAESVVGCLCGIGDLESVGSNEDRSAKAKKTLWEDYGEGFYPYLFPPESDPYIVIVTATTVKEFRGEITYATTAATKTYVNLQMDHITSLIQKFATKTVHIQTIKSCNGSNIPIVEAMFQNRMTITELLDSDWSYDIEECFVTLRAQISQIDTYFGWHYIPCN